RQPPAAELETLAVLEGAHNRPIRSGEIVQSNDPGEITLALIDGSRIEMRSKSELWVQRTTDGLRIQLNSGGVIVNAAKQGKGHLYVQTKDVVVSVIGTVFYVHAEEKGSRVAVIEGEVQVRQGEAAKKLFPGDQVASNPVMQSVPVLEEIGWSRNIAAHLA